MAKPPAGSSLLFGALADTGLIRELKNGSSQMKLEGIESINWFTDRPQRAEGTWKPQKLLRKWDKYFASSEPNAQVTVEVGEEQQMATFEMFKPKMKSGQMMFNIKPISDSGEDKLTGLEDIELSDISLFIDSSGGDPKTMNYLVDQDMTDEWGWIGNKDQVAGLQYGDPLGNKKVSDEIFSAFEDGTIELVAFPQLFEQDIIDGLNKAGLDGDNIAGAWFLGIPAEK